MNFLKKLRKIDKLLVPIHYLPSWPSSQGILGYKAVTSIETGMVWAERGTSCYASLLPSGSVACP